MPMAETGWADRRENYVNSYLLQIAGTTATAINSSGTSPYLLQPIIVFGVNFTPGEAGTTGDITLVDGTASADSGDTRNLRFVVSSGTVTFHPLMANFTRGLIFDKGVLVSATTVTGALNILYKNRY